MWAAGNKQGERLARRHRGLTLLELLVVVAIIAMATASVAMSMPDNTQVRLEREAQRLAALLESARSISRAHGVPVRWQATAQGFRFEGLPGSALPGHWLDADTAVNGPDALSLGPEPLIERQSVTLVSRREAALGWRVGTDGLRPFAVEPAALTAGS
ncbi:MAG: prepilin-type N-terminal cleavage/methylation domain-containing protein [Hylemonella sp.]|nr:prepilin-type N-terminal cleavage/methylation domain-containing protein [Hylemonella sp.]